MNETLTLQAVSPEDLSRRAEGNQAMEKALEITRISLEQSWARKIEEQESNIQKLDVKVCRLRADIWARLQAHAEALVYKDKALQKVAAGLSALYTDIIKPLQVEDLISRVRVELDKKKDEPITKFTMFVDTTFKLNVCQTSKTVGGKSRQDDCEEELEGWTQESLDLPPALLQLRVELDRSETELSEATAALEAVKKQAKQIKAQTEAAKASILCEQLEETEVGRKALGVARKTVEAASKGNYLALL